MAAINDLRLAECALEARSALNLVAELAGQGKLDQLWDAWKIIRDAGDRAMTRIGQIENGL